ncbi:hypothetical protein CDEF62S_02988 [Castellaniella defragrans]
MMVVAIKTVVTLPATASLAPLASAHAGESGKRMLKLATPRMTMIKRRRTP